MSTDNPKDLPEVNLNLANEIYAHVVPKCDHVWDGKGVEFERGFSVSCSKCGMLAITYSMMSG